MSADEEGEIRCICGFVHDDGFTIQCEKCLVWQHAVCVEITEETGSLILIIVPELYFCEMCEPRTLDKERAIILQGKRMKDSGKGKKVEEKKKRMERFEKPSPRKRKESPEIGLKAIDGRKKKNKDMMQSPPRKKFKDSIGNDIAMEFERQKPRGRPRLHSVPQIQSRQSSPDPFIIRKKDFSKELQTRFSTIYEEEYASNLQIFASCSRCLITPFAKDALESIQTKTDTFPLFQVLDIIPNLSEKPNNPVESLPDAVAMLEDEFSLNFKAIYDSVDQKYCSGAKKMGLFATENMDSGCFVSSIMGVISGKVDLDKKDQVQSLIPICKENRSSPALLAPPFVFCVPGVEQSQESQLWIDSREFGGFDGRFVRSCCGANENDLERCNATLKLVWAIDYSEIGDRKLINSEKLSQSLQNSDFVDPPVAFSDRPRLGIFTTKAIKQGEEIILQPGDGYCHYSCICEEDTTCYVNDTISFAENFKRSKFGDPDIPTSEFYDTLSEFEIKRQRGVQVAAESNNKDLIMWNYLLNQDEIILERFENEIEETPGSESEQGEIATMEEADETKDSNLEISNTEMEELLFGEEPSRTVDSSFEDFEMVEDKSMEKQDIESLIQDDGEAKDTVQEDEAEKVEPKRVSLRDFMKQKSFVMPSTETHPMNEAASEEPSNLESSVAEIEPPSENLTTDVGNENSEVKISNSPEYQPSEVGEIVTPDQNVESTKESNTFEQSSPKPVSDHIHPKSYSTYEKSTMEHREPPRYNSDILEYERYTSYESKGWRDNDRGYRERRESEPMHGLKDDREIDKAPERVPYGRSYRESFPPASDRIPREKVQYRSPTITSQRDSWSERDHRAESMSRDIDPRGMKDEITRIDSNDKRMGFRQHDRREDSWNSFDNRDRYTGPSDRFQNSNERYPPTADRFPPSSNDRFSHNSGERFPPNGPERFQGPNDRFIPPHQYSNRGRGRPYFPKPYYHQNYRAHDNFNDRFGPPREQLDRERMYGPSGEIMHDRERDFEWKKRDPLDFVDTLEKTQLYAVHWGSDEDDDEREFIVGILKQLSMLSTEFFILSRTFLDTIDEHLNHIKDILAMERELHHEIKCRIKMKRELLALTKKNPKVSPVTQDDMIYLEDKTISNYAKVQRKYEILERSVQDKKVELMSIRQTRTPLVIKELLFQYSKLWDTFSTIYESMKGFLNPPNAPKDKKETVKGTFKIGYASPKQLQTREIRMESLKKWLSIKRKSNATGTLNRIPSVYSVKTVFPGENPEANPVFKQVLQLFDDQVTLLAQIESRERDGTKYIREYIDKSISTTNMQKGQQSKQAKQKAMLHLEAARYKVVSVMEENKTFRLGQWKVFAQRKYTELIEYSKTLSQLYSGLESLLAVQSSVPSIPNLTQPEISVADTQEKPVNSIYSKMAIRVEDNSPAESSRSSFQGDTPASVRPRLPSYSVENVDSSFRGGFSRRTSSRNSLKKSNSAYSVPSINVQAHEFTPFAVIEERDGVSNTITEQPESKLEKEDSKNLLSPQRTPSQMSQNGNPNVFASTQKSAAKNAALPPLNKPPPPVPVKLLRKRSNSSKQ
ncbi:myeloid lymphoid or mixed-lineage leukemia 5 (trithorax, ) [Boothiomyces macroporosus]|uniref:Myeloid lymphoid or mixed-lineage leukemia 5 (Trithorax, ) n=1 Tax=Boothiomyces macroporosus TaxID=261099 RepID=A0AAD5UE86_9FUNG|nr:myeloid lymphoid or mixed-lineage leukemia 5 (trithorax, ) [Boothiomyces macroporosus]